MAGAWNSEYHDNREPQHASVPTPTATAAPTAPPAMYNTPKTGGGSKKMGATIVGLRLATFIFSLVALAILASDKADIYQFDTVNMAWFLLGTITFTAVGAYKFMLAMNVIVCFYSLCQLIHAIVTLAMGRGFPQRKLALAWATFICDHVLSYMLIAAGAAGAAVALIFRGNFTNYNCSDAGITHFCSKAEATVGITFVTWLFLAIMAAFSSRRLFKLF